MREPFDRSEFSRLIKKSRSLLCEADLLLSVIDKTDTTPMQPANKERIESLIQSVLAEYQEIVITMAEDKHGRVR